MCAFGNRKYLDFISVLVWVVIFASQCCGYFYDEERIAMKKKQMDLEYGEKLSSIEYGDEVHKGRHVKLMMLRNKTISDTDVTTNRPSTKCSTDEPITLNPLFVPSSIEDNGIGDRTKEHLENSLSPGAVQDKSEENVADTKKKSYLGPPKPKEQQNYYDDE